MSILGKSDLSRLLAAGPVAVLGAGTSGQGVMDLLVQLGFTGVLYDENPAQRPAVNKFDAGSARLHPLVVHSPGFAPDHPWLLAARAAGAECLPELDFASGFWKGTLIAVTGTNGKTSLTEFLTHALHRLGRDVQATGNIGSPFSRLVAESLEPTGAAAEAIAVCEVSSFQAETLRLLRADAVLWTNFAEDHLDRHGSLERYFDAKANILERVPADCIFVGASVQRFARQLGRPEFPESSVVFSEVNSPDPRLEGTPFSSQPQRENFLLAEAWWRHVGLPEEDLIAAARTFHVGRHRLAPVAETDGVTWWNDSKATNFHAVEAAVARFAQPVLLIAGGRAKGGDPAAFARRLAPRVQHAFLIGECAPELAVACGRAGIEYDACGTLGEAVSRAAALARPGDHVLLSPGFASFDQFRGYAERGEHFESLVNNLGVSATFR